MCDGGTTPAVDVTNTGTGTIRVTVGSVAMDLTAVAPSWHAPWPEIERGLADPHPKWDAVRLDTMEIFATGTLDLPPDCPPPPIVPGAPQAISSTPGDGSVSLSWLPPASDGGAAITGYAIEYQAIGAVGWVHFGDVDAATAGVLVTGLVNGTTYMLRVIASNANGPGEPGEAKDTPRTVPGAPRSLLGVATNVSGQVHLTWLAPVFDGGTAVTDYVIERSPHGANTWTIVADGVGVALSVDVDGLTPLASYDFRVHAVNDAGPGPSSNIATAAPRGVPSAPRSLVAAPTNVSGQVRLTWVVPLSNGGSAVTDYIVQRSPNGTTGWATISDGVNTNTTYTVAGLVNGTRYYFRVLAHNAVGVGNSPASNVANAIPRTLPTAARSLTVSVAGTGMLRLTWLAPTSNGGSAVTDYIIQRSANGTTGWATVSDGVNTNTTYSATGLVNGTRYYFRVYAHNAVGNSPTSNVANAIPVPVPTAPRSLVAAPTNVSGQVRLTWVVPLSNGGSAVTDYIVQRSPNGTTGWATISDGVNTNTTYTLSGLLNGTRYYFRVYAHNAVGNGPISNVANAIPRTLPTAARALTAAPTNLSGQIRLTWLAPTSNGGSAVTDYVVQRSPNGTTGWTTISDGVNTNTTYTVAGLVNGTRYYFRVYAHNAVGNGPVSNTANAIPRTVPTAARSLTAAPTNLSGQVRLTWLAPTSNGGSAVTDYIIQRSPDGTTSWTTISDGVNTNTTYTVAGLVNGTRYYFRVYAHNAAGNAPTSNVANAVPRTVPGQVSFVRSRLTPTASTSRGATR